MLMVLSLQAFGQKLNVISVSPLSHGADLSYINGEEPLFTGTSNFSLIHQNEQILVVFGSNSNTTDPAKNWLYKLDEDLLTTLESNELADGRKLGFDLGIVQTSKNDTIQENQKDGSSRKSSEEKTLDQSDTPLGQLWAQYKNGQLSSEEFEIELKKATKRLEKDRSLSINTVPKPNATSMHFGGSQRCYLLANYNEDVTSGDFEIKVIYQLPGDKSPKTYVHTFSDEGSIVSSVSEYQMDVNSKGHLVYLRHYYSSKGSYQSTRLVHCTPEGSIVYNKQLGFFANMNSFLLEFEDDTKVKILGIEDNKHLALCQGTYNTSTNEIVRHRDMLLSAQIASTSGHKTKTLSGNSANTILGYKHGTDGTYIFLSKNAPATEPMPYYNTSLALKEMRLKNKELSYITEKDQPWKLRSTSNEFYVVKLDDSQNLEWINGLDFGSIWINDIGDGNNFPILFNTQDKKWTKQLKGVHKAVSEGIGMPMSAIVTSTGLKYVQPSYDLLEDGYLILTKAVQLGNGEYVGFGAKVTSLEYDQLADGFYEIGVSWHVVRFEVSD